MDEMSTCDHRYGGETSLSCKSGQVSLLFPFTYDTCVDTCMHAGLY
jgi:hypothetical protein